MGIFLGFALFVGVIIGLVVTGILGCLGIVITYREAKQRLFVWRIAAIAAAVFVIILIFAVRYYGNAPARPGSDYDIVMRNFFIWGVGYSATPGLAVFIAAMAVFLCPKKKRPDNQESNKASPHPPLTQ